MGRAKNDWRASLGRKRMENLLRISEDGPDIKCFDPSDAIELWYSAAARRLGCRRHKYPEKRGTTGAKFPLTICQISLSDIESDGEEADQ